MGLIYSTDIVTLADVTLGNYSTTELVGYEHENLLELDNLCRHWRCADLDAWSGVYFAFSAPVALAAIAILDANFTKVKIYGSADTSVWSDPTDYYSQVKTISQNPYTGRYNIYIDISAGFTSYQYLLFNVDTTATAVGPYTTTWKAGSVVMCYSVEELTTGKAGMSPSATQARATYYLNNGRPRVVKKGSLWRYEDVINFPTGADADREEVLDLFTADDLNPGMLLYYNNGDTSQVYFGTKDASYQTEYVYDGIYTPGSFKFIEYI